MKKYIGAITLIFLLVACTMISPSPTYIPLETASTLTEVSTLPASSGNHLYQALAMMPASANYIEFTDWGLIKKNEGFEGISSADELDQRMEFYMAIAGKYVMPSFYGRRRFDTHSQLWGWDSTDLEWEAASSINSPPAFVLKFRDDFDFKPVLAYLQERGFKKTDYQNIPIYSHELDISLDWMRATELSIRNTAVIEEESLLVMSGDYDMILSMMDAYQNKSDSLTDSEAVLELIQSLEGTPGAFISNNVCSLLGSQALIDRLAFDPMKDTKQKQARQQLNSRPELENYEALGIGYSVDGPEPVGKIVLQFSDPEKALKDLEPRQELARTGMTRGENPQPYEEVLFSLSNATVQGSQIIMEVVPAKDRVVRLFEMVQLLDMNFATCP